MFYLIPYKHLLLSNIRVLVKSYRDNNTWYNWYSDGWLEQGGYNTIVSSTGQGSLNCSVPLPREYAASSVRTGQGDSNFKYGGPWNGPQVQVNTTNISVMGWSTGANCVLTPRSWVTYGYSTPPTASDWSENLSTLPYKRYIKY